MDLILYNIVVIFVYFVGFGFCSDPQDITSCDPEEFDVNDLLNDPLVIEALESNEINVEQGPSQHEPLKKRITRNSERTHSSPSYTSRKLICLGLRYQGNKAIPLRFQRLEPAEVNPDNLTKAELERKFHEQGEHSWRELEEYPVKEHRGYWGHVCDYFWVKKNPKDPRHRACYIKSVLFSDNAYASIKYNFLQLSPTKAEVLRCTCHYYVQSSLKLVHPPDSVFAVHKYSDNEYFILKKLSNSSTYKSLVFDFWTKVILPIPIK